MTGSPLDVLRHGLEAGRAQLPDADWSEEFDALGQVETLVAAASDPGLYDIFDDTTMYPAQKRLAAALAPFVSGSSASSTSLTGSGEAAPTSSMLGSEGETA